MKELQPFKHFNWSGPVRFVVMLVLLPLMVFSTDFGLSRMNEDSNAAVVFGFAAVIFAVYLYYLAVIWLWERKN